MDVWLLDAMDAGCLGVFEINAEPRTRSRFEAFEDNLEKRGTFIYIRGMPWGRKIPPHLNLIQNQSSFKLGNPESSTLFWPFGSTSCSVSAWVPTYCGVWVELVVEYDDHLGFLVRLQNSFKHFHVWGPHSAQWKLPQLAYFSHKVG